MVYPVIIVHSPSPVSSAKVTDLTLAIPSTSSMASIFSIQMQPVHLMPSVHPMPPVPSTLRGIQENYDDYCFEAARRSSFRNWSVSFIDPASLVAAGIYYTGEVDVVRCFECQLVVSHWSDGDIPMRIQEMCSPECSFILNEHCDNVQIGADPDTVLRSKRRNRDTRGPYGLKYEASFDFNELSRLGLKSVKKPANLEYETSAEVSRKTYTLNHMYN
jgi:hypothetical protein